MSYNEQATMIRYGIRTEADWYALPLDERERKVAFVMASNFIDSVSSYEAAHAKS
jgi:hypothetical protein